MNRTFVFLLFGILLSACATTPPADTPPAPITDSAEEIVEQAPAETPENTAAIIIPGPAAEEFEPEETLPPPPQIRSNPHSVFNALAFWQASDHRPAFSALTRTCRRWQNSDPDNELKPGEPRFGRIRDWQPACQALAQIDASDREAVRRYFESHFLPVRAAGLDQGEGLLTAYYQPEIEARKTPDKTFREPILAVPSRADVRTLPREQLSAASGRVIGFGRPADVFFMQIQGSGILVFKDGTRFRAAYADNNGHAYTSIGAVLIRRGELTKTQASKQSIEAWMKNAGPLKARELMNQNKRYIFFKEQVLTPGEGPPGAMRIPLTAMGSLAIDRRFYPYGVPVWINTRLPATGGDYRGRPSGLLLVMQDTGKAIRGPLRGDIYFGTGTHAGSKAGVMKHKGDWTLLLPINLATHLDDLS